MVNISVQQFLCLLHINASCYSSVSRLLGSRPTARNYFTIVYVIMARPLVTGGVTISALLSHKGSMPTNKNPFVAIDLPH